MGAREAEVRSLPIPLAYARPLLHLLGHPLDLPHVDSGPHLLQQRVVRLPVDVEELPLGRGGLPRDDHPGHVGVVAVELGPHVDVDQVPPTYLPVRRVGVLEAAPGPGGDAGIEGDVVGSLPVELPADLAYDLPLGGPRGDGLDARPHPLVGDGADPPHQLHLPGALHHLYVVEGPGHADPFGVG